MNFYWFGRTKDNNLAHMSEELEQSGFSGILLPYAVDVGDYSVQVARAMNTEQKLKYILAIRPYTISPQHLAMIVKSLNSIDPDRIWINFVSGQILDEEKTIGGIIGEINDLSSQNDRRQYLESYVPVFVEICKTLKIKTNICISGMGEDIGSLVEGYGDYNFAAYQAYAESGGLKKISKPRVLSMFPLIEDDEEIFNKIKNSKELMPDIKLTTTEELKAIINSLKLDGIDSVMFYCYWPDKYRLRIVDFIKNNKNLFI
jgi:hypothetical protein